MKNILLQITFVLFECTIFLSAQTFSVEGRIEELIRMLDDDRFYKVRYAAEALGNLAGKDVVPELITAISKQRKNSMHYEVPNAIATALKKIGGERATAFLIDLAKEDSNIVALEALGTLYKNQRDFVEPLLIEKLHSKSMAVRCAALKSLGTLKSKAAISSIIPLLKTNNYWSGGGGCGTCDFSIMSRNTIDTIVDVTSQSPEIASQLLPLLQESDWKPRYICTKVLVKTNNTAIALPAVIANLKNPDPVIRARSAETLGYLNADVAILDLADCITDPNLQVRESVILALRSIGPEAIGSVDYIIASLPKQTPKIRREIVEAFSQIGSRSLTNILRALPQHQGEAKKSLISILGEINADSTLVISTLIDHLKDSQMRYEVVETLAKLGPKAFSAVPELLLFANDKDIRTRQKILWALGRIKNPIALPQLIENAYDNDETIRKNTITSLRQIGVFSTDVIAVFTRALSDPNRDVASEAARAFVAVPPQQAISSIPVLLNALEYPYYSVREYAIDALQKISPDPQLVVPTLIEVLNKRHEVREIVEFLGEMGDKASPAIPELIEILKTYDYHQRKVIETLGKIGPKAHSALPELIHILQNSNNWTNHIQETIQKIGLKANPYLLKMLQHKKTEVRQRAIATLGKFGLENSHLIPILTPFLKDDSPEVREVTVTALVNMGAKMSNSNFFAAEDVNTLLQLTQNNDIDIKKKAIRTLGKMGKSDLILKALQKNLQDSSYEIRLIAACSLFQLGEKEKTRPILLTALSLDEDLQLIVIQFLGKMGAESYFAVKELRKITKNFRRSRVFFTAQAALKKIRQN